MLQKSHASTYITTAQQRKASWHKADLLMEAGNGLAWSVVSEHRETCKDKVDDTNVKCHASQHDAVISGQRRLIKQRLQNEERQSR